MNRPRRAAHRFLWPLLAVAVSVGVAAALLLRAPPAHAAAALLQAVAP
jgi:hypothetical protein